MVDVKDNISLDISVKSALLAFFVLGLFVGIAIGGAGALTLQDNTKTLQSPTAQDKTVEDDVSGTTESDKDLGSESESKTVSISDLDVKGERSMGEDNAEVTMVYFGDFNCMYCYRFAQQTLPQIKDNFVKSGDVEVVYKNLITMGENSITLAKASEAAWDMTGESDSEVYWEFHSQLHEDQKTRKQNSQSVMEDIMDTAAKVEGIESDKLRNKMEEISDEEVTQDVQEARKRSITGTPGFILFKTGSEEGIPIQGAQPYSSFESEINKLLEK